MNTTRALPIVVTLVFVGAVLYLLAPVLTPFLIAALLAYIGSPAIRALERARVPRVLGVVLVFLSFATLFLALMLYLVPLLAGSVSGFVQRLPEYYGRLIALLPRLEARLGISLQVDVDTMRSTVTQNWKDIGEWTTRALGVAKQSGLAVIGWLVNLVLIPIVTFYLMLDWERIVAHIDALVPPRYQPNVRRLARETDAVLANFLRGQLLVMAALSLYYALALWIIGLDVALPIGVMTGVLSFVPYLGFVTGLISAGIAAYLQAPDTYMWLWVVGVYAVGQGLESYALTPRLVGRRVGLHPVIIMFAVLAGAQLFGIFGALLAVPVAAALNVWLRHARESLAHASPPKRTRRR